MHHALLINVPAGKIAEAFCGMLVHSLWQGLLFTIITGAVMLLTKKSSSRLRYNIMCVLFMLFLVVCAITFVWHLNTIEQTGTGAQQTTAGVIAESKLHVWLKTISAYFTANAPLIVTVWGVVFLAKCARMMAGLVYSQRIKHYKTQQVPQYWQAKMEELSNQLNLKKKVQLLQSGIVKIPVVIGHLKPIVFVPLGLLNNLPAGEIEAVLLHELAHIRRNDYFVNIIQVMAENVFFFNPALLWMSSIIRDERENCCDDVAVAQTKSKKQFIQALISFKEHALHANKLTTAFPAKKNQLLQRVTRIINNSNKTLNAAEKTFFLSSFIILSGLLMAVTTGTVKPVAKLTVTANHQQVKAANPPGAGNAIIDSKEIFKIDRKQTEAIPRQAIVPAKKQAFVYTQYTKIITVDNIDKIVAATQPVKPVLSDDERQAVTDRQQAEEDRKQAERDRAQAVLDQQQAMKDQQQAMKDQQQAMKDQQQAVLDQQQAERDRLQAEEDRKQAERDRAQAEEEKKQADREKAEADKQRVQDQKGQKAAIQEKATPVQNHKPVN